MALSERTKEILKSGYDYQGLALDMYEDKCDNCIELQKRIDKAIEYIEATYNHCLRNIDWLNEDDLIEREEIIKLLDILRGKDNE